MRNRMFSRLSRRFAAILAAAFAALFLASCRDFRGQEPERGALVAAIGADADGDGIRLSLEVLVPREGDEAERRVLSAAGPTAAEAYAAALSGFPRAPLFGHCAVMVFGDGISDDTLAALLSEQTLPPEMQTLPPEMQAVTAPNAAELLRLGELSTPAVGYDLQAILSRNRQVHCRIYELSAETVDRSALPRFSPAPDGSGKPILAEFPQNLPEQTDNGEGNS